MEFSIKSGNPEKQRTACLVLGILDQRRLTPAAENIDTASRKYLSQLLRKGDIRGRIGESLLLQNIPGVIADRVLLIGCGREREIDEQQFRQIVDNTATALAKTGAQDAVSYLTELNVKGREYGWKIRQSVEVSSYRLYEFSEFKSKKRTDKKSLRKMTFAVPSRKELSEGEAAIVTGMAVANGVKLTRDIANRPSNVCTPTHLAEQAQQLAAKYKSIRVKVLDSAAMEKLGMNSLLSVAQGSDEPPCLITLEYRQGPKNGRPVVLVGKGVTFDTGGISLKPAQSMEEMKYDMCGAASVIGTIAAIAELGTPVNLVGVIPATENMPSGSATKPGDIFTSMSGQTIEVLNTDAEGRLILCDAITYSERFNPGVVIDIATLTGACVVALGRHASGLLSNHNPLAKDLINAGITSGDRAWQLPLWPEYEKQLDSAFADMANIGGRDGGTITAACFLSKFARKLKWAHLDIAGTAWTTGNQRSATGRPVSLLAQYILDKSTA